MNKTNIVPALVELNHIIYNHIINHMPFNKRLNGRNNS